MSPLASLITGGTLLAGPAGANPSRSDDGDSVSVTLDGGGEPSLLLPLLVLAAIVVAVGIAVWWWRHLGGWSPAEMTLALQTTGRDVDRVGESVRGLSPDSPAVVAYRRAAALPPTVLRRDELSVVQAHLAEARSALRSVEGV